MRVVATAGHVDHGKSSLVRSLTGTDPDRLAEEQRRGLTIDLGFAHANLPSGAEISFIDVPGHVRFLRNMLAGVGGVDACVFVVAATEGWKPQSEEHLRILELLGIRHGIIVMTMADLVDDDWLQLQQLEVGDRVAGTFLGEAPIVPFSSTTGAGRDEVVAALELLVRETPQAVDRDRPRLWVDRVFAARGAGTVVTGTLTGGSMAVEQRVTVEPDRGDHVRVRSIQVHGRQVRALEPGNRAALNLSGIAHERIGRGDAIVVAAQWRPTDRFDATLDVLGSLRHDVSRRGAYLAYIGSGEVPVQLRVLGREAITPGGSGLIRLRLPHRLPLLPGDRFVLRESGREETVGGGEVLDIAPVLPASRARPDRDPDRVVAERGAIATTELIALTGEPHTPTVGRWSVSPEHLDDLRARLRRQVDEQPLGLDLAALDDLERAVIDQLDDVRIDGGRATPVAAVDPLADHPAVAALLAAGVSPGEPVGLTRAELRELVRRGTLFERDGIHFHTDVIEVVARRVAALLADAPAGITMSQLREAVGTSRKFALPLASELDARGITRRRGDLRLAGPKLPPV